MRAPAERLRDILDAIAAIEKYIHRGKPEFERDELLQVWLVQHLQIVGEAVANLDNATRQLAPDVAWSRMVGMRNILVHSYFAIDLDVVWDTAVKDLPGLKDAAGTLLGTLDKEGTIE